MSKPAPMKGKGHHNKVQTASASKNDGKRRDDDSSFVYNLGILIGCVAEIETRGGDKFEGVLSAFTNQALKIMIEAAHEPNGDDESSITKHYDLLIVPADKVSVIKFRNAELTYATRDFQTDAVIGASRQVNVGNKELTPWEGADDVGEILELDATNTNGWEADKMFKENEEKYGVVSSFSKDLSGYTTQLDKTDVDSFKKHEEQAAQIAQEIEGNTTSWERSNAENGDENEEEKFSAVRRPIRNNSNHANNNPPPPSNTASSAGTEKYVCPSRRPQQGNIQGQGHPINNNGPPPINNNNGNARKLSYDGPRYGAGSAHQYHARNFDTPGRGRGHPQYQNTRDRRDDGRPHRLANKPPMDRDRRVRNDEQVNKLKQFGENFRLHGDSVPNRMRMPPNQAQHPGPPINAHINTSAPPGNNVPPTATSNIRNPSPPNNNSALQISSTQPPVKPNNKKEDFSPPVPPLVQPSGPTSTNSENSSGSGTNSPHNSSNNPPNASSASPSPNLSSTSANQTTNETTPNTPGSTEIQSSAIVNSDSKGSTEANKTKKFQFNPDAKEFVFTPKQYTPQRSPSTPPRPPSTPASTPQIMAAPLHSYMPLQMTHQGTLLYAPPPTTYTTHAQAALTPSSNSSASSGGNTPRHSHRNNKGMISGPPRSELTQPMQMAQGPPILAAPTSIQTATPQQFAYVTPQGGAVQQFMRVVPQNMMPIYQTEGNGGSHMHQSMHYLQHSGGTPQNNAGHQQASSQQSNPNAPTSNPANGHVYSQGGANHGAPHHMGYPIMGVPMVVGSYPHGPPGAHVVHYVTPGGGNSGMQHSQ